MRPFRPLLACVFVATSLFALLQTGCTQQTDEPKPVTIAVIPKMASNEYWDVLHAGVKQGVQELQNQGHTLRMIWDGPAHEEALEEQIELLRRYANDRVDAIILSPQDRIKLVEPVREIQQRGIPVLTFDSTLNLADIPAHIGTDNYQAGMDAADYLAHRLNGKGRILMQRYVLGSASSMEREAGFANRIRESWPEITILPWDTYASANRHQALDTCRAALQQFAPQTDAIFVSTQFVGNEMLRAINEYNTNNRKIPLVIFDTNPLLVQALEDGKVTALVVQSELLMGREGLLQAWKRVKGEPIQEVLHTPVQIIDRTNMHLPEMMGVLRP
jgi:ribose transport system substrate-binding protein